VASRGHNLGHSNFHFDLHTLPKACTWTQLVFPRPRQDRAHHLWDGHPDDAGLGGRPFQPCAIDDCRPGLTGSRGRSRCWSACRWAWSR